MGIKKVIVATFFVVLTLSTMAWAVVDCPVPDTGQTKCYDDDYVNPVITCPQPGEPFYGQDVQYSPNPQSYTQLDASGNDMPFSADYSTTPWAMVRDNVTGLIWEVKHPEDNIQDYNNPHDADNSYTWYDGITGTPGVDTDIQDFIAALNSAEFGGYDDWRLPTVKELSSIIDSSVPFWNLQAINTDYFHPAGGYYWSSYWSSSDYAYGTSEGGITFAWKVSFGWGGYVDYSNKSYGHYVRAVRGGQCGPFGNYVDNGDGTVTDNNTGLMWEKENIASTYTWERALHRCDTLSHAGYYDWRLPNRHELQSIVDYNRYNPAIDPIFNDDYYCWSSTTDATVPRYAWYVYFPNGRVGDSLKWLPYSVKAVRGGLCGSFGDSDYDGICDDGDDNGTPGDNPCTGGETVGCDDNCLSGRNPHQYDCDIDGQGDVCDGDTVDADSDGVDNTCDNCPDDANQLQEDEDGDDIGDACDTCTDTDGDGYGNLGFLNNTCSEDNCPNTPNSDQLDTYPPQGNGIGDACDCEGDFTCDGDVDAEDVTYFLWDFGRNEYNDPCTNDRWCYGDFNCDVNVDANDVINFLEDFGRSQFFNPCPACEVGNWCVYP